MKPAELINYLSEYGADIVTDNGNLSIKAPRGLITKEIKSELVFRKSKIIELLQNKISEVEFILLLENACTNLELKPEQLWRFLSSENIDDLRNGLIDQTTLRAYAERWDDHPHLVPVGNNLPFPKPPEQKIVACKDCQHFTRDMIGDDKGIGSCAKGLTGEHQKNLYPRAKRICALFKAI